MDPNDPYKTGGKRSLWFIVLFTIGMYALVWAIVYVLPTLPKYLP